jgi:hypothetical protein
MFYLKTDQRSSGRENAEEPPLTSLGMNVGEGYPIDAVPGVNLRQFFEIFSKTYGAFSIDVYPSVPACTEASFQQQSKWNEILSCGVDVSSTAASIKFHSVLLAFTCLLVYVTLICS